MVRVKIILHAEPAGPTEGLEERCEEGMSKIHNDSGNGAINDDAI